MTEEDLVYIRNDYVPLSALVADRAESVEEARAHIAARRLPGPAYVLPDGTEMFPRDWFTLADRAGSARETRVEFERRFRRAAEVAGEPASDETVAAEWDGYLGGMYGVCLREVTPENVFRKEQLVRSLTAQLAKPEPEDAGWRTRLRDDVNALDLLLRPFAPCDRIRFGGTVSRDRLIAFARTRYPEAFGPRNGL